MKNIFQTIYRENNRTEGRIMGNRLLLLITFLFLNVILYAQEIHTNDTIRKSLIDVQSFFKESDAGDDGQPLKIPIIKDGKAVLNGHVTGQDTAKNEKYKGNIYVFNPILGELEKTHFETDSSGYFSVKIPLISTTLVKIISPSVNEMFVLSPSKESLIHIDLEKRKKKILQNSKSYDSIEYLQFAGDNANINNQLHILGIDDYLDRELNLNRVISDAKLMNSTNQYKDYIEHKYTTIKEELLRKGLSGKIYELVLLEAEMRCADYILLGNYIFREIRKNKKNDEGNHINRDLVFDYNYYSFLRTSRINDPMALYSNLYFSIIHSCNYIGYTVDKYKTRYRVRPITGKMIQTLVESGKLTEDERKYAASLKDEFFDNWSEERISKYRKQYEAYANRLLATNKLTGKSLQLVNHLAELSSDDKSNVRLLNNLGVNIPIQILEDKLLPNTFLQHINDSIFTKEEFYLINSDIKWSDFIEKYKDELDFMQEEEYRNEQKKILADILGTDKGLLFDMISLNQYGKKIQRKIPLTECELNDVAQMDNPHYLSYLTDKNQELIEENKKNSVEYHVYKIPDVNDDLMLSEIANMFPDKVLLITFWATWSVKSTQAIEQLEKVKKNFKDKDIIYIYLSDGSSPLKTWENRIQYISGEHFRLRDSQLNFLKNSLNLNGNPSFLILNKKRKQVYKKEGYNYYEIQQELRKLLK